MIIAKKGRAFANRLAPEHKGGLARRVNDSDAYNKMFTNVFILCYVFGCFVFGEHLWSGTPQATPELLDLVEGELITRFNREGRSRGGSADGRG